jgi:hypothetical protein
MAQETTECVVVPTGDQVARFEPFRRLQVCQLFGFELKCEWLLKTSNGCSLRSADLS